MLTQMAKDSPYQLIRKLCFSLALHDISVDLKLLRLVHTNLVQGEVTGMSNQSLVIRLV
jgi:hypothetical protein